MTFLILYAYIVIFLLCQVVSIIIKETLTLFCHDSSAQFLIDMSFHQGLPLPSVIHSKAASPGIQLLATEPNNLQMCVCE